MQWSGTPNAGFSDGTPWIMPPNNFKTINVQMEEQDEDSILNYYKTLIRLRKENPVISDGQIEFLCGDCADVFAYRRFLDGDELLVYNNLTGKEIVLTDAAWAVHGKKLIGNYEGIQDESNHLVLRPYESIVYRP